MSIGRLLAWAALLGFALTIRLAYLQEHRSRPDFHAPLNDALYHHAWARALAFHDSVPPPGTTEQPWHSRPFFKAPGYPYLLAAAYRALGDDPTRIALAQIALGLLSVILLVHLGRACGGPAAGWWAGALGAGSWNLVYYEQELMEPVLLVPLLLGFLLAAQRATRDGGLGWTAWAGILLGGVALVRPNFLLFVPLAMLWMVWRLRGPGRAPVRAAVLLLAAFILTTLPSLVRNARVGGEAVWFSANGGINLYLGNNPDANGVDAAAPDLLAWSPFDYPGLVRRLEAETGRPLSYRAASRHFTRRALDFWREQPGAALALTARKALYFWSADELANEADLAQIRAESRILHWLPFPFAATAGFGLTGLLLWWALAAGGEMAPRGARSLVVLMLLLLLAAFASVVPFFAASRFRLPVLPLLYVWAGLGFASLPGILRREGYGALLPWAGVLVMVGGLVAVNHVPGRADAQRGQVDRALSLMRLGRVDEALQVLERLAGQRPQDFYVRGQWGSALLMADRPEEALRQFDRALEREPGFVAGLLGRAQALARLGRMAEARQSARRAVEREPGRADGWVLLAATEHALDQRAEADAHFRQALQIDPRHVAATVGWGYLKLQNEELAEAAALFRRALQIEPDHPEAQAGLRRAEAGAAPE
jgi:tetratricopeptide (TPR) repeat protein